MRLDDFIARLEDATGKRVKRAGAGYEAHCPTHQDRGASLSVSEGDKGIVLHCHAGCEADTIVRALGLEMRDLFEQPVERPVSRRQESKAPPTGAPEATYDYVDIHGELVLRVVRFPGKKFRQCRPPRADDPPESIHEGMVWRLGELEKPLYRLPELLGAVEAGHGVFIVEGEKDVEAIYASGGVATCNVGGSGAWRDEYAIYFEGAHVQIVVDKDDPGEKHALQVAETLEGVAASVRLVQAKTGKDAADHLAAGHGRDAFIAYEPKNGLVLVRASDVVVRDVEWVIDYEHYIPYGGIASLMGDPGVNKSTFACKVAAQVSNQSPVLYLSAEDARDVILKPRLIAAGAEIGNVVFPTMRMEGLDHQLLLPKNVRELEQAVKLTGARLLVIDPIMAHLDGSTDSNNDQSVRLALSPLAMLAERRGIAVLLLMHTNKASSSDPYVRAGGSKGGLVGLSRTFMLMGYHPDADDPEGDNRRVLVGWKSNWGPKPHTRVYQLTHASVEGLKDAQPRLDYFGTSYHRARHVLKVERKKKGGDE